MSIRLVDICPSTDGWTLLVQNKDPKGYRATDKLALLVQDMATRGFSLLVTEGNKYEVIMENDSKNIFKKKAKLGIIDTIEEGEVFIAAWDMAILYKDQEFHNKGLVKGR